MVYAFIIEILRIALAVFVALLSSGKIEPKKTLIFKQHKYFFFFTAVFLLVMGVINLFFSVDESIGTTRFIHWTSADKKFMVSNCINASGNEYKEYPNLLMEYCKCSTESITNSISKTQFVKQLSYPLAEQKRLQLPFFKHCFEKLKEQTKPNR